MDDVLHTYLLTYLLTYLSSIRLLTEERPVTSSSELFADIAEKNHQKSTFICPRIPRSCPPTDWSRVGYGGDGIDRQAKGMYTDSKEQLTTTMES